ncbi:MAG: restriction endonuclease subunit S [Clostridia bacterium]|nr:restriction endonuclease subunit S [Clostridia bacterium]
MGERVICIDRELPFEIPNNWTWCRLQSICEPITDGTHQTPIYSNNGYVFLSAKNVTTGSIDWENVMYIPESLHQELYSRIAPRKGDILLAKNGTIGVAAIVDRDCEFDIYVTLALIRTVKHIVSPHYLLKAIGSTTIQKFFKGSLIGIGVPNLHLIHIRQALIPIPPLEEQERLSNVMKEIFDILSNIEHSLS